MIEISKTDVFGWEAAVPVAGFPSYRVDKSGNVYNAKKRILKQHMTNNGYLRVSVNNEHEKHKTLLVHRVVATAFIPNAGNLPQVNHIDENKTNNSADNLEWCTAKQNLEHSRVIEQARAANFQRVECVTTGKAYNSIKEVTNELGLSHGNIVACCKGRRKMCGGLEWKYAM